MLKCNIVRPTTTRVLITLASKRLLKVVVRSIVKQVKAKQKKPTSTEFILPSQNASNLDITMFTPAQRQKLAY